MHVKFISASLISNARSSSCFMTSPHELVLPIFLILVILLGMKWYLTEILIYISLVTNDAEHLSCAYWLMLYPLWGNVYSDPLFTF